MRGKALLPFGMILSLATVQICAEERDVSLGEQEYEWHCALCHGVDGGGKGTYAELLTTPVPNIRTLQKNNKGVFPFERVYAVIDGRAEIRAHGPRDMPIWGNQYNADAMELEAMGEYVRDREAYIRSRILALISHISTLQE